MSKQILILGDSGSGKSTSIKNLPVDKTFIVNVIGKDLPFKGSKTKYKPVDKKGGNMLISDDYNTINRSIEYVDQKRPEIKNIVIDDSQYLIINEFMKRHAISGKGNAVFALYNEIGDHFWNLIWSTKFHRDDLFIFFLHHTDYDSDQGKYKAKTIGKMLDEKVNITGMFTYVLYAKYDTETRSHVFETNTNGQTPAKTPAEMFESLTIPNDLQIVKEAIINYDKGE